MAFVDERVAESLHEKAKAISTVRTWGGKDDPDEAQVGVIARRKARLEQDEDVVSTRQGSLDAYAYRKLVEARHEALVRDAAVVSRELTRRVDREAPTRRADRWGGGR